MRERVSELRRWLELLEYGHADGPVEIPVSVLFPPAEIKQLEPWVGLVRREVAQAAIDVEELLKRSEDES